MNPTTKTLIGAVIAAVLAIAVYYGAISQQSASSIQNQANQTLGTTPASQQTGAPTTGTTTGAPTTRAPTTSAPAAAAPPAAAPTPPR